MINTKLLHKNKKRYVTVLSLFNHNRLYYIGFISTNSSSRVKSIYPLPAIFVFIPGLPVRL